MKCAIFNGFIRIGYAGDLPRYYQESRLFDRPTFFAARFAWSVVFRCRAEGQGGASRGNGGGESSRDSLLTPSRRRNLRKCFLEARRDTHATYPRQESCCTATKPGDFLLATGSRLDVPWFERRVLSLSPTEWLSRFVPLRRRAFDGHRLDDPTPR